MCKSYIVHDQASNMELTGQILGEEHNIESLSCAAHRLQLCINEGLQLNALARAIAAAKKLVSHFKHSALATNALSERQETMNMKQKRLQQECPTRWNSTYYMIQTLLENRWPVTAVLADETFTKRQHRYLELSSDNWMILEELVKSLHPLEIATTFMSAEYNASLSSVIPVIHGLTSQLVPANDDSSVIKQFKNTVVAALKRRWSLENADPCQISMLATVLDPRFRNLKFLNNDQKSLVQAELLRLAAGMSDIGTSPSPKRHKSALDELLGDIDDESENSNASDELSRYFTEKVAPRNSNPLDWWKQNEFRFKRLAKLAKEILGIPATSTASERLFSTAGLTVTKLRNSLKPDNVDALVFLNKNFDFLDVSQIQL